MMRGFDKWEAYFPFYERVISRIRPGSTYLEIGVQNLGWLEAFDTERKFSRCVACDINPKVAEYAKCTRFTDVIIGDSTSDGVYQQIASLNEPFDMIVDDASHTQHDIIKNFLLYFPLLFLISLARTTTLVCLFTNSSHRWLPCQRWLQ